MGFDGTCVKSLRPLKESWISCRSSKSQVWSESGRIVGQVLLTYLTLIQEASPVGSCMGKHKVSAILSTLHGYGMPQVCDKVLDDSFYTISDYCVLRNDQLQFLLHVAVFTVYNIFSLDDNQASSTLSFK